MEVKQQIARAVFLSDVSVLKSVCLSQSTFEHSDLLNYKNIMYSHIAHPTLKHLVVYHSDLRFITGDKSSDQIQD